MRTTTYLAFLAGSAAAQSTVSLLNFYDRPKTLTQIGSDSIAATYTIDCPASKRGIPTLDSSTPSAPASAVITSAPRLRFKRQAASASSSRTREGNPSDESGDFEQDFCEPYTLKQGASTWSFGFTDPTPNLWTVNMECKWQGAMTDADMTCTGNIDGDLVADETEVKGKTTTSVIPKAEFASLYSLHPVAIVTQTGSAASGSGSAAPSQTPSGSGAPSTGLAPAGPMPTGAMALVGGAAGVFAALAL